MAHIGYPNTKNKKVSSTPLFNKKKDKEEATRELPPGIKAPDKYSIQGPKVSYDMAYKNRDMKTYGNLTKEDYIKEAKRQTKSVKATGKWDVKSPESYAGTKESQPTDPKKITSENVTVKSNKEKRKEKRAENKKGRATKRITKLQNKAAKKGSLTNAQKKRLARNEQKSKGEKVSDENRTKAGKLIGKVGSKIKTKIAEIKKKKEEKKKKKNPITYKGKLKGKNKSKNLKIL